MREGLRDLSISRTTFTWGVPVPDQPDGGEHIMYVWLDALTNYLTALGYPDEEVTPFTTHWPAALHMVGKDILRFHAIYWPAFLMAAGLPLPSRLFAHGWWTVNGEKMSKSVGNVIEPVGLVDEYGCDPVRYFMVNEVSFGGDGDFSHTKMADCLNAKLANELGNLAYRTLSFSHKHCDAATPTPAALTADDHALLDASAALLPAVREHIDAQSLHKVTQTISSVVQMGNQYIDVQAPWSLRKTDTERMATVLWVLLESMRFVGILYQPVVPSISAALLDQLGVPHDARSFAALAPGNELVGGAPLPTPAIIIPRYEKEEDAPPPPPPPTLPQTLVELLLAAGADPNVQNCAGETPIHFAARNGRADAIRALLAAGAKIDTPTRAHYTGLHVAAAAGQTEVVKVLLEAGAQQHPKSALWETPLTRAHQAGHFETAILLQTYGVVDPNAEAEADGGKSPKKGKKGGKGKGKKKK